MPAARTRLTRTAAMVAVLGAAGVAIGLGRSAEGAPGERCVPPFGFEPTAERVVRGSGPHGGPEVTEHLPGGAYRVTRCDAGGRVTISQTVAPVAVPGGRNAQLVQQEAVPAGDGYRVMHQSFTSDEAFARALEGNARRDEERALPPTRDGGP